MINYHKSAHCKRVIHEFKHDNSNRNAGQMLPIQIDLSSGDKKIDICLHVRSSK